MIERGHGDAKRARDGKNAGGAGTDHPALDLADTRAGDSDPCPQIFLKQPLLETNGAEGGADRENTGSGLLPLYAPA